MDSVDFQDCSDVRLVKLAVAVETAVVSVRVDEVLETVSGPPRWFQVPDPSDEDFLQSGAWKDELTQAAAAAAAGAADHGDQTCEPSEGLQEHQYCIPGPAPDSRATHTVTANRVTYVQTNFVTYNHIAR